MIISRKMALPTIAAIAFSGFLSGCSLTPPTSMMNVQAGNVFVLKQKIQFAPDTGRQFIQFGKLTTRSGFGRRDQHCRIEMNDLKPEAQTLLPETFKINKVRINVEEVAQTKPIMTAALDTPQQATQIDLLPANAWLLTAMSDSRQPPETMDTVLLYLEPTAKNPNILRLVCSGALSDGSPLDAPRSYRPQKAEINQILGSIGEIR